MGRVNSKIQKTVAIVGAGPGGLAAAILLAVSGVKVTVFERRPVVGGRTSTIERDGFHFDTGPTFFLYPRVLREIFAAAGFDLEREIPMVRLDPQYRLVYGSGGELLATPDVNAMEARIRALCPRDAAGFRRFLADNREKLDKFIPFLESPFETWRDLIHPDMLRLLPLLRPWRSLNGDLLSYFSDERIRLSFSFQSKYLGMSPFSCPSLFSILSFLEYEHGVFHPLGGCGSVTGAMARVARSLGVEIALDEPVEELYFEGRKVTGLRTSQRRVTADSVVINADFAGAMQKLVPDRLRRRWTDKKIAKKRYSCSTFMMYLGIRGRYDDVSHHTIYLAKDYRQNLREIECDHCLSDDPSFYVQNASVTDSSLAPAGHSTLYVLLPVTHDTGSIDWPQQRQALRATALRQLARIGMPDVEERIVSETILTPQDWGREYGLYRGATFAMAHSLRQMLHMRPHNRFEDLEQVYLVGGGTHPGSGLPVIFESARISARLLLEDLNVAPRWNTEPVVPGVPPDHSIYEAVS